MKKIILAFILLFILSPIKLYASGEDSFSYSPNPIPEKTDITFTIKGKGFGFYSLTIATSLPLDFVRCQKQSGNTSIYKSFSCQITNEGLQEWTATIVRAGLIKGTYNIVLNPNKIIESSFTVGEPRTPASFETLSVSVFASGNRTLTGPFSDKIAHNLTVEWSPALVNGQYEITTSLPALPALPLVTCSTTPCSTTIFLAPKTSTGTHVVTVKQAGQATRGSANFTVTSERVSAPTPTSTPTPAPLCNLDKKVCHTAFGDISTTPEGFIKAIFGILLSLAGGAALILIIISGYRLMTSQGNPEKVQAAREQLTSAIVGLLFIIFSLSILQIIGVDILKIPGLNR